MAGKYFVGNWYCHLGMSFVTVNVIDSAEATLSYLGEVMLKVLRTVYNLEVMMSLIDTPFS